MGGRDRRQKQDKEWLEDNRLQGFTRAAVEDMGDSSQEGTARRRGAVA